MEKNIEQFALPTEGYAKKLIAMVNEKIVFHKNLSFKFVQNINKLNMFQLKSYRRLVTADKMNTIALNTMMEVGDLFQKLDDKSDLSTMNFIINTLDKTHEDGKAKLEEMKRYNFFSFIKRKRGNDRLLSLSIRLACLRYLSAFISEL